LLVLADAFIQESVKNGSQPFSIGWVCNIQQLSYESKLTTSI
jgi:ABC-type tungstate transport system permease subunit